ncbi:MAG: porin family protein [Cyclobacteriaceae bacterium]|jgi:hypothetical protein
MKKTTLLLMLMGIACVGFAQPTLIPRLGLTLSNTSAEEEAGLNKKMTVGFSLGVGLEFNVHPMVSIQPELSYVQKGFGLEFGQAIPDPDLPFTLSVDNQTHINYLELPVLVKFYPNPETKSVYLLGGPSLAFGLGGKNKASISTSALGQSFNVTVSGDVKFGDPPASYNPLEDTEIYFDNRIDFGLQGGLGVLIAKKIVLEARYNLGFSNLVENENSKNRVIHFSVGVPLNAFAKK